MIAGVTVGFCFDVYRALRRWLKWGPVLTFGGDIAFSIGTLFLLFNFFLRANYLAFRFYILWGSLLGLFLYLRLFSRTVTGLLLLIFDTLRRLLISLGKLTLIPFRGLMYLMQAPYAVLRWFSLLIYRLAEATFGWQVKTLGQTMQRKWRGIFPPRTNG